VWSLTRGQNAAPFESPIASKSQLSSHVWLSCRMAFAWRRSTILETLCDRSACPRSFAEAHLQRKLRRGRPIVLAHARGHCQRSHAGTLGCMATTLLMERSRSKLLQITCLHVCHWMAQDVSSTHGASLLGRAACPFGAWLTQHLEGAAFALPQRTPGSRKVPAGQRSSSQRPACPHSKGLLREGSGTRPGQDPMGPQPLVSAPLAIQPELRRATAQTMIDTCRPCCRLTSRAGTTHDCADAQRASKGILC
jgi:hypothetical protein